MLTASQVIQEYGIPERTARSWFERAGAKGRRGSATTAGTLPEEHILQRVRQWQDAAAKRAERMQRVGAALTQQAATGAGPGEAGQG